MEILTEDTLKYIPFAVAAAVLIIAGAVYLIVQHFKNKK